MIIRKIEPDDFDRIWPFFQQIVKARKTYAFKPDMDRDEAFGIWVGQTAAAYVAVDEKDEERVLGSYFVKANADGPGSHVCNSGYMVAQQARGKGVGEEMCRHSQKIARSMGFKAMQFNLVVQTNKGAIRLWKKMGFKVIGTIPKAYDHREKGLVDALIMYKWLADEKINESEYRILTIEKKYDDAIQRLLKVHWGSSKVVTRGRVLDAAALNGFMALSNGELVGLITCDIRGDQCEIVSLNAQWERKGIGTALIESVVEYASAHAIKRVWLITTNDNIGAMSFYHRRGFTLSAVHRNAIENSRVLKPEIPLRGENGIPIMDEYEFEKRLS